MEIDTYHLYCFVRKAEFPVSLTVLEYMLDQNVKNLILLFDKIHRLPGLSANPFNYKSKTEDAQIFYEAGAVCHEVKLMITWPFGQ